MRKNSFMVTPNDLNQLRFIISDSSVCFENKKESGG